jgi:hypothetical protein
MLCFVVVVVIVFMPMGFACSLSQLLKSDVCCDVVWNHECSVGFFLFFIYFIYFFFFSNLLHCWTVAIFLLRSVCIGKNILESQTKRERVVEKERENAKEGE